VGDGVMGVGVIPVRISARLQLETAVAIKEHVNRKSTTDFDIFHKCIQTPLVSKIFLKSGKSKHKKA
jgi:hypothetical protein